MDARRSARDGLFIRFAEVVVIGRLVLAAAGNHAKNHNHRQGKR